MESNYPPGTTDAHIEARFGFEYGECAMPQCSQQSSFRCRECDNAVCGTHAHLSDRATVTLLCCHCFENGGSI